MSERLIVSRLDAVTEDVHENNRLAKTHSGHP